MAKHLKEFIERLLGIGVICTDMITKTKNTMDDVSGSQRDIETFMRRLEKILADSRDADNVSGINATADETDCSPPSPPSAGRKGRLRIMMVGWAKWCIHGPELALCSCDYQTSQIPEGNSRTYIILSR
jgi:hypothetical protein